MAEQPLQFEIVIRPPLDAFLKSDKLTNDANRELEKTMQDAAFLVHSAVIPKTPHASGTLRSSIQPAEPIVLHNSITGAVSTSLPYAPYVEYGSKPHWAPIGPLLLWAQRKHHDPRIAYIAQKAIAKRGTKAWHMFRDGLAESKARAQQLFDAAVERILAKWRQ
ncbi:HK97 gp10 family phage protein [bacterium]|nr:HK97 gp10 family phage protein [bacterium]